MDCCFELPAVQRQGDNSMKQMRLPSVAANESAILHCSLLGPPHIAWAGLPFAIARRQARALIYCLVCDLRPIPRDRLVFLLWPDEPDATARRNLIRLLSSLRQALPHPDLLLADNSAIALNPTLAESDTARFAALCASAAATDWETAISLYRGRFLDGFSLPDSPEFDQWLGQTQRRYERDFLDALRRLITVKTEVGDFPAAIRYAQQYLADDDLAEDIHRQLIALYVSQGDRAAALRQFEQCTVILERELGAPPLPETRAAYAAARDGASLPAPQPLPAPQWGTLPSLNLPLIGRDEEWQTLTAAYRRRRRGGVIAIAGEPGVGKSRLMQEFATAQSGLTLTGASYAAGQSLPYQPLAQALRLALPLRDRWRRVLPVWLAELARLLPELRSHFPDLPRAVEVAPRQAQARLCEALTQAFFGLAGDSPLLLCLDDLQWADDATLGWLAYVTSRLAGSGLCILATYRSQDAGRLADWQAALNRAGMGEAVQLTGLSETAVAELLRRAGVEASAEQPLAARIHAATGGNAFFALETIRAAQTTGALCTDSAQIPLPPTVRDAVARRVGRLTPLAQQVLAAAAVLAPHLRVATLLECAGRSETEIIESLEEALAHQLLRADGAGFRFQHDLARQAVYAEISPWRRRLLHQRAAESLTRLPATEQDGLEGVIAHHFAEAGEVAQAIEHYQRAAALAQRLYAHQEAAGYLRQALALAEGQPAMAATRLDLREALADALTVAGHFAQAEENYRAALGQIAQGERLWRAALQHKLAKTLPPQQRADEAIALHRAALALLDGCHERACQELRLEILLDLMDALYYQLRVGAMAELEEQIQLLLEEVGATAQRVRFYSQLNQMALIQERYRLSSATVELIRNALASAQEAGDAWQIAHLRFGLGFNLLWRGDLDGAEAALHEALALAAKLGDHWSQTQCLVYLTILYRLRGETALVGASLPRLLEAGQTAGSPFYLAVAQANRAWLRYRAGDFPAARAEVQAALSAWKNSPYPFQWLAQSVALALALREGDLSASVAAAQALLQPSQQRLSDDLAEALAMAAQTAESGAAQAHLARAVKLARSYGYL